MVRLRSIVAVLATAPWAAAALSHAASDAPQQPVFRSQTITVQIDAIVQDRDGTFVGDLRLEDFELLEDGKPQRLETLLLVRAPQPQPVEAPPPVVLPGPASVLTNDRRIFVFFFDSEHLSAGGFKRLQAAALDFVSKELGDGDVAGVVIGGALANGRLTSNREELRAAIARSMPRPDLASRAADRRDWPRFSSDVEAIQVLAKDQATLEHVLTRACQDAPEMCAPLALAGSAATGAGEGRQIRGEIAGEMVENVRNEIRQKAQRIVLEFRTSAASTLQLLAALTRELARLDGRKSVIFLTEGFFADQIIAELRNTVGAAGRAGVAIYAIDARGLNRSGDLTADAQQSDSGLNATMDLFSDGPNSLAVETGGYFVRNENNFARALSGIARDASTYYVLAYSPLNQSFDGRYRRVDVRVRRDGVKIRARRGYVATQQRAALAVGRAETAVVGTGRQAGPPLQSTPLDAAMLAPAPAYSGAASSASATTTVGSTAGPGEASEAEGIRLRPGSHDRIAELASAASATSRVGSKTQSWEAHARTGWELYERGDVAGAEQALGAAAESQSAAPWVHYALGQAEFALWRFRKAVEAWERVRAAVPEYKPLYFDLADGYLQLNDTDRALETLRQAESRWPDDPEVPNALGVIQTRRGALGDAIESFGRATTIASTDALAYFNLGKAFELRYYRSRRWSNNARSWMADEQDRLAALENYQRYVQLGGPFEDSARRSIQALTRR
ncbi:MAG: VWA domain-containing protein [Acidobacteria bacterium]|nr:VWA domain-containing protein [Acidobacteriota bacterium]